MSDPTCAGGSCDQCDGHTWHRVTLPSPWDDWDDWGEAYEEDEPIEDDQPTTVWRCWSCVPFPQAADLYFLGATHRSRMLADDAFALRRHYLAEGAPVLDGFTDISITQDIEQVELTSMGSGFRDFRPGRRTITLRVEGRGHTPSTIEGERLIEALRFNMRGRSYVLFDLYEIARGRVPMSPDVDWSMELAVADMVMEVM